MKMRKRKEDGDFELLLCLIASEYSYRREPRRATDCKDARDWHVHKRARVSGRQDGKEHRASKILRRRNRKKHAAVGAGPCSGKLPLALVLHCLLSHDLAILI